MRRFLLCACLGLCVWMFPVARATAAAPSGPPEPERAATIATWLPEEPRGAGRPIDDRPAWEALAAQGDKNKVLRAAELLVGKPLPKLTDELYLEFTRTGNRSHYQNARRNRHDRLTPLVAAECIENRGRFLPEIERVLEAVCDEKTWVYPAHDRELTNFKGPQITIDLCSSATAWELATADYWLGNRLRPAVRQRLRDELERRIFTPFEAMVRKGKPRMWWLVTTNNWNAVCLANVTGAALTSIPSLKRRAFFVASAEKYVQSFLSGFTPDGYCSEGLGYWNYGFGHYVMLGELLLEQTGGRVDLFADPRVRTIAQFGRRMEILPGIWPALADCPINVTPAAWITAYMNRTYAFGWPDAPGPLVRASDVKSLALFGLFGFANVRPGTASSSQHAAQPPSAVQGKKGTVVAHASVEARPLRDFFPDAGVLVCRPAAGATEGMGVVLKGGHNAEHHNHNDLGSFVVALGHGTPLVDPGAEEYTWRTFSANRYKSGLLNSWGHPVSRVAGQLQRPGREAAARVLRADFSDTVDTFALDLRAAYDVESLEELVRTFVYSREGRGSLRVSDRIVFDRPEAFGTALVTFEKWRKAGPNRLIVGEGAEAVQIEIAVEVEGSDAGGAAFTIRPEVIREDRGSPERPIRLGIDLAKPVREATLSLTIRPR